MQNPWRTIIRSFTRPLAATTLAVLTLTSVGAAACPRPDGDGRGRAPGQARAAVVDRDELVSRASARTLPPDPALPAAGPAVVGTPPPVEPSPTPPADPAPAQGEQSAPDAGRSAEVGVPDGAALTPMAGGAVEAGGVIADVVIDSDVVFTGSDLTLRNVRVNGEAVVRGDRVTIETSEFAALAISGSDAVTVSSTEVFGLAGRDGIHITSDTGPVRDVVIRDSLIHTPKVTASSHYDGIQVRGVDGLTLDGVRIELGAFEPQHNAALFLEDAGGGNRDVTVTRSVLSGGGYTLYSFADDVAITDTVLDGGHWGALFPRSQTEGVVTFSGNTDGSGRALRLLPDAIG